nr:MAG TPA: hypothetical protein [Crassvirales sp.]
MVPNLHYSSIVDYPSNTIRLHGPMVLLEFVLLL